MIVAEVGQNHIGHLKLAKHLIYLAQSNGADLVKFQLFNAESLYKPDDFGYKEAKEAQLTKEQAFELFKYGKELGIEVFFSVFDAERVKWCEEIGVKRYKIAHKSNQDEELLLAIKETGKPIIISAKEWGEPLTTLCKLLYCVPSYPTALPEVHLENINFDVLFQGISDHTIGMDVAKMALARGAQIIEKHFAVDHKTGIDAEWSMMPSELRELKKFEAKVKEAL